MKSLLQKLNSKSCDSEEIVEEIIFKRQQKKRDKFVDIIMEERNVLILPKEVKATLRTNGTLREKVWKIIKKEKDEAEALEKLDEILELDEVFLSEESSSNEDMYHRLVNSLSSFIERVEAKTKVRQ